MSGRGGGQVKIKHKSAVFKRVSLSIGGASMSIGVADFAWPLFGAGPGTNFCNFVTKVNKIAKTVGFPGNFVYKAPKTVLSSHS